MGRVSPNFVSILVVLVVSGAVCFTDAIESDLAVFTFVMAGWLASLCLHEFGHALVAWWGGDGSIAGKGYLDLDPARFVDPVNSLLIPLAALALGGIALPGAAVYVETRWIRGRAWLAWTSAAGPIANLAVLVAIALPFALGLDGAIGTIRFWAAMGMLAFVQASTILFNLLPVPGFDGYGIAEPWLPYRLARGLEPWKQTAPFALILAFLVVPGLSSGFAGAVAATVDHLGIDAGWVFEGFRRFRFWHAL